MNTPRALPPAPPARGSFPLDHAGECKAHATAFLACIKQHGNMHAECRDLSKAYLECRMDRNLMAREDLETLGFAKDVVIKPGADTTKNDGEIIAGLAAAKRAQGFMFGIGGGGTGQRGGGH